MPGNFAPWLFVALAIAVTAKVPAQEDPVIAIVNDHAIRSSDVNAQIVQMPLGDQVSVRSDVEKFAESLIQEEVLFQSVLVTRFADEPVLRNKVKEIIVNHLIDKHVTQKLLVSDAQIEQFYQENTSAIRGETIEVSHILSNNRAECDELKDRVDSGESFAELARQYSLHERSAKNDGKLGSMMNHDGPLGFERQLFEIPENTARIFESDDGCHVILVTDRNTPPLPPLENVSPGIENLLKRQIEIDALQNLMEHAHSKVTVIRP